MTPAHFIFGLTNNMGMTRVYTERFFLPEEIPLCVCVSVCVCVCVCVCVYTIYIYIYIQYIYIYIYIYVYVYIVYIYRPSFLGLRKVWL
jgi:hypothetical protein